MSQLVTPYQLTHIVQAREAKAADALRHLSQSVSSLALPELFQLLPESWRGTLWLHGIRAIKFTINSPQ